MADEAREQGATRSPAGAKTVANRPEYARFSELPICSITPLGWLKGYLEMQSKGMTGHLDETGGHPFNTYGWAGATPTIVPPDWWSYEQTAYWIDGMIRCGHLLRDKSLIAKARTQIDYVLAHPDKDGYLGPQYLKQRLRWPHVVFFRALFAENAATGDARITEALKRHFLTVPYPHTSMREICAIEAMLWTYERDRDPALLRMAEKIFRDFLSAPAQMGMSAATFTDGKPTNAHGVGYNETAKLGALLYLYTGSAEYLDFSRQAYRKIDRYHMLVDGVHSSSEIMREVTPLESHETCNISDYTWSVGYLLMATGEAEYADKIERACFNAAPGAVTEDFTALQYFSCPNQVVAAHNSNHNIYYRGDRTMAYATNHIAACCSGNVNRAMPNFAARMWMRGEHNGLVATLYGPSVVTCKVGAEMREVTIQEQTHYPFSDRIRFAIETVAEVEFPFTLRIPGWCSAARIQVNNAALEEKLVPGSFVTIARRFRNGDEVVVELPQETKLSDWPMDGVAVERGPLVYSLKIDEQWNTLEEAADAMRQATGVYYLPMRFPGLVARDAYPKSPWNYALAVDPEHVERDVKVIGLEWDEVHPWSHAAPPIELRVPARRVLGWELDTKSVVEQQGEWYHPEQIFTRQGNFVFTPQLPSGSGQQVSLAHETETVTLVPYGCAKLRLTIFPKADKIGHMSGKKRA
jgi:hypothetical protein